MFNLGIKITFTLAFITSTAGETVSEEAKAGNNSKLILSPQTYSKLLIARRKDHEYVVKSMLNDNYEKSYKMINFAYDKIFEVIKKNNQTLVESHYDPQKDGFPKTDQQQQEAVTLIIENSCLFSSIFLHFPEISFRILKKKTYSTWKDILNWSIDFVNHFPYVMDESTTKLIQLARQQIQDGEAVFVNQKRQANSDDLKLKENRKKSKKKLKKGPQLTSGHSKDEL